MENTNVTEQSTNEIMPMAASGETNFASLPEKTTPASGDMFLMEDSENTKKINYDKLADAILNKLTSKTYSGLETTAKNFVNAINELNRNIDGKIQYREITVNITNPLESFYTLDSEEDVRFAFPSANKIIAIGGRKTRSDHLCIATVENNSYLYAYSWSPGEYKVLIIAFY